MRPSRARLIPVLCVFALSLGLIVVNPPAARASGQITGHVTDGFASPLENMRVEAFDGTTGQLVDGGYTDENGDYSLTDPQNGRACKVLFIDRYYGSYAMEWYSGAQDFGAATPVTAPATGIDAQLEAGVAVSGTVTDAGSGAPIVNCGVELYDPTFELCLLTTTTDGTGDYSFTGAAGSAGYRVYFLDPSGDHLPEWYDDKASWLLAEDVTAPAAGIDAELLLSGTATISGAVTDGGGPLEGITVRAYESATGVVGGEAHTETGGVYTVTGLDTGVVYKVLFVDENGTYAMEWYADAADFSAASPVTGSDTGIDAQLEPGVTITGTVRAEGSGIPVPCRELYTHDPTADVALLIDATTDTQGEYVLRGLRNGAGYKISFHTGPYTDPVFYNARDSWANADVVNAPATGIDATVPYVPGATVTGHVTDSLGVPLAGIRVNAYGTSPYAVEGTVTDPSGDYILDELVESSTYNVLFTDQSGACAMEWYSNAGTLAEATGVVASATGIDAQLEAGVTVTGALHWEHSGLPVSDFTVRWADPTRECLSPFPAQSEPGGTYALPGLRSSTDYRVSFWTGGYGPRQWYHGKASWASADDVTAPAAGIDDTLDDWPPAPEISSITPSSGTSGQTVEVTNLAGAHFQVAGTTVVRLAQGGSSIDATNVDVVDSSRITCRFELQGAAAGQWDVYVENPDTQSATKQSAFTVIPPPPSVTSVTPAFGPPGTTVTVAGNDFGDTRGAAGKPASGSGTSYVSFNGAIASEYPKWTDTEIQAVVPDGASAGPVTVTTPAGTSPAAQSFNVCAPTWYLAEGTSNWGFDTYLTIENPNPDAVQARVTYMTPSGPVEMDAMTLPALSQSVINPRDTLGATDFSTRVECVTSQKTIAVDRRMIWTGQGASSQEGHSSVGVTSADTRWYLPEGSSNWGFECWLLVQNPNPSEARCTITYMIEGGAPVTKVKTVPASTRATYSMLEDAGEVDASIMVESDLPVIPERAMYRNARREGHDSIGTTAPAQDYFLAEGTSDWGFTTYVLVQNPNTSAASVEVTFMASDGPHAMPPFSMAPSSRGTIRVNDVLASADFSTRVHSDLPIVAERAMYWDGGRGEACHDSIGMPMAHRVFYLPDGETQNGHETWVLVQNPNDSPVEVEVRYLLSGGAGVESFSVTVPPLSRRTFSMADEVPNGRASVTVTCLTPGKRIICERAMYWNNRGAGTDTIGAYSD